MSSYVIGIIKVMNRLSLQISTNVMKTYWGLSYGQYVPWSIRCHELKCIPFFFAIFIGDFSSYSFYI